MNPPLRILHLDDNPRDAELIRAKLEMSGLNLEVVYVEDRIAYENALQEDSFDVILCDFNLPDYDGISALKLALVQDPGTPVILISGSLGEDEAVQSLQLGATDYLLKQRLERLPAAVERAVLQGKEHTKRLKAEEELKASEERFRNLAEQSDEGFWFVSLNPELFSYVSPGMEKIWGQPATRFYEDAQRWKKSILPHDFPAVEKAYRAVIAGDQDRFEVTFRIVRPDDSIRWVQCRGVPIKNETGAITSLGGVAHDITAQKENAEQQERTQRLESIGMLASGISHDFNNALSPIIMATGLLRRKIEDPSQIRLIETIDRSTDRGVGLVKQLMSFARGSSQEQTLIQVRHLLRELDELVGATFPKSIQRELYIPNDLWTIKGNASQIHQVFLNLFVNARDAMANDGKLSVVAENCIMDESSAASTPDAIPGRFVSFKIKDTGCGIAPESLSKIWDPFFTTKESDKGTGLGLSTARGIVQQHHGFMHLETRPNHGTTFTVYLPAAEGEMEEEEDDALSNIPHGKGELILVAEDDEAVRTTVEQILTFRGYEVVTACDGADAIAKFSIQASEIQLLLTDMDMPILGGRALIAVLRRTNPQLKVITMSGAESETRGKTMLAKPFQVKTLLTLVRHTLDEATNASPESPDS